MKNTEIIQNSRAIYKRFQIPPWLQRHMITSAAVAELICDNWNGPELDKTSIVARNLIHDLGNIVKMNLDSKLDLKLAENSRDKKGTAYWKEIKKQFIQKYGSNDALANIQIAKEIPISSKLLDLLRVAEFKHNTLTLKGDWEAKIGSYSDQRSGPFGVLGLKERYDEHRERYKRVIDYLSVERNANFKAGLEIEKQIQKHLKISVDKINDETIKPYLKRFY